jgi:2,3-bisphosphoglycerate-dependent phosphoglycerate mutase
MRIVALLFLFVSSVLAADPTTVILVRHAEKAGKSGDVPLSEAGVKRAHELARVLAGVKIDAIYTTPFHRTRQTAAPVAGPRHLEPIEIDSKEVAARIRKEHSGGTVLVIGHSNTTPEVIRDLGIAEPPEIPDSAYDDLFIVTISERTTLLALRYGAVAR